MRSFKSLGLLGCDRLKLGCVRSRLGVFGVRSLSISVVSVRSLLGMWDAIAVWDVGVRSFKIRVVRSLFGDVGCDRLNNL